MPKDKATEAKINKALETNILFRYDRVIRFCWTVVLTSANSHLDVDERNSLVAVMEEKEFKAGDVIIQQVK